MFYKFTVCLTFFFPLYLLVSEEILNVDERSNTKPETQNQYQFAQIHSPPKYLMYTRQLFKIVAKISLITLT